MLPFLEVSSSPSTTSTFSGSYSFKGGLSEASTGVGGVVLGVPLVRVQVQFCDFQ
jgi:hypothetical protein